MSLDLLDYSLTSVQQAARVRDTVSCAFLQGYINKHATNRQFPEKKTFSRNGAFSTQQRKRSSIALQAFCSFISKLIKGVQGAWSRLPWLQQEDTLYQYKSMFNLLCMATDAIWSHVGGNELESSAGLYLLYTSGYVDAITRTVSVVYACSITINMF